MNTPSLARIAGIGAAVITAVLVGTLAVTALFSFFQRPPARPDPVSMEPEPDLPRILVPPQLEYTRVWAQMERAGYFNFTDGEWKILSANWAASEKSDPKQPTLVVPQGLLTRLDASALATMITLHPKAKRTNTVWFVGAVPKETETETMPVTAPAPSVEAPSPAQP